MYNIRFISLIFFVIITFTSVSCSSKQSKDSFKVDSISEIPVETEAATNIGNGEPSTLMEEHYASSGKTAKAEKRSVVLSSIPRNGKPTIVDFSATWCGPCKMMKPIFDSLAEELSDKFNFVSIDVDEHPELATKYQIQNIPAFVFLDEDGIEGDRKVGACSESELRDIIVNGIWH